MIKKIVTLLISLSIVLSAFPCSIQAASADSNKQEILEALNVIDGKMPSKVTHNDFVNALMNIVLSGGAITSPEGFADNYGLTGREGVYNGKEAITVAEAVKYAVIVAGYDIMSKDKTIDSYLPIGADLELLDGVKLATTANLTGDAATTILFNLLEVNPLVWNYNDSYETQNEEDMLGMYRDIYYHKGIVTANEYTAVNSTEGLREGMIQINGENFDISIPYDENVLGKWVEVYVQESRSEDPAIIYVGTLDSKNEILEIEAKDIETVAEDFSKIDYYVNDGNKVKTAKLANNLKVIYNGEFYGDYATADLKPDIGKLELVSNDGDNTYEIVKVTSYQTMIVEAINASEKIITNKYEFDDCLDYIDLEDSDVIYTIIEDNTEIKLSDISVGDVLSVAKTKNVNDVRYKIYVSSITVETTVNSLDSEEMEIDTEEDTYCYSSEYEKQLSVKGQKIDLGKAYLFYFDVFGNIVYSVKQAENDYCLLYRMYIDDGLDDAVYVKYLTYDNEWQTHKLREKVKFTDTSGVSTTVKANAVYNLIGADEPQIVKLKLNKNDEINAITLAHQTSQYKEDTFTKTRSSSYYYRSQANTLGSQIYMTDTTKIFVLPSTASRNTDEYYVVDASGYFNGDALYNNLCAYDIDNFGFTELLSIAYDDALKEAKMGRNMFIITSLGKALSSDDEVCTKVVGTVGGLKDISFLTDNESLFSNYEPGNVINFVMNRRGMINAVRDVANLNDEFTLQNTSDYHAGYSIIKGIITDIDSMGGKIKLDCNGEVAFRIHGEMSCTEYNKTEEECELITIYDLMKGDKLLLRLSNSCIQEIIRVKE